ncbi:hypothetical protein AAHH86_00185 [Candidatus Hodgkinia cicadicola]
MTKALKPKQLPLEAFANYTRIGQRQQEAPKRLRLRQKQQTAAVPLNTNNELEHKLRSLSLATMPPKTILEQKLVSTLLKSNTKTVSSAQYKHPGVQLRKETKLQLEACTS